MALPYDAIVPNGGPQPRSAARLRAVGATMAFAMLACVALFAGGRSQRSELMISQQSHVGLNRLADHVLKVGSTMSVDAMAKLMQNWSPRAPNKLDELSPQALKLLSENDSTIDLVSLYTVHIAKYAPMLPLRCRINSPRFFSISSLFPVLSVHDRSTHK